MNYTALVLAAGKGTRMGLGYNKMFFCLDDGETVLHHSTQVFLDDPRCKQIVIVTNKADMVKVVLDHEQGKIVTVIGGDRRQDSVLNGLMAVTEDVVFIHDGARPYVSMDALNRLCEVIKKPEEVGCILVIPVKDTVKKVVNNIIEHTVDRDFYWFAQTPQVFKTNVILDCYIKAKHLGLMATDDAQIVEMTSDYKIKVVMGELTNIKITEKSDID